MGSDAIGAANIGTEEGTLFNSCKAASAASSQTNLSAFFSSLYIGVAFSPRRLINRLTAATQPVNLCTSLRQVGRFYVYYCLDLLRIYFYASMRDYEAKEFSCWYAKDA